MNYTIIESGVVVNIIVWDGTTSWAPPSGGTTVQLPDATYAGIGSTYSTGVFGTPPQIVPLP